MTITKHKTNICPVMVVSQSGLVWQGYKTQCTRVGLPIIHVITGEHGADDELIHIAHTSHAYRVIPEHIPYR